MAANEYKEQRHLAFFSFGQSSCNGYGDETQRRYCYVRSCEKICKLFLGDFHPKLLPLPQDVSVKLVELLMECDKYILEQFPDAYVSYTDVPDELKRKPRPWKR